MEADDLERSVAARKLDEANNHPSAWTEYLAAQRAKAGVKEPSVDSPGPIRALYREALEKISVELHRNNALLIDIWLDYAKMCSGLPPPEDAAGIYRRMRTSKIGLRSAKFYIGLADCELSRGSPEAARNTIATGMSLNAQPPDLLVDYLEKLKIQDATARHAPDRITTPVTGTSRVLPAQSEAGRSSSDKRAPSFNDKENVPPPVTRSTTHAADKGLSAVPPSLVIPPKSLHSSVEVSTPTIIERRTSDLLPGKGAEPRTATPAEAREPLQPPGPNPTLENQEPDDQTMIRVGSAGGSSRDRGGEPSSAGVQSRFRRMDRKRLGPPKRHAVQDGEESPKGYMVSSDGAEESPGISSSEQTPLKQAAVPEPPYPAIPRTIPGSRSENEPPDALPPHRTPPQPTAVPIPNAVTDPELNQTTLRQLPQISAPQPPMTSHQPSAPRPPAAMTAISAAPSVAAVPITDRQDPLPSHPQFARSQVPITETPNANALPMMPERPLLPTPPLQRSVINPKTHVEVNGVVYARLEVIGRGGSSKVYKLMAADGKQYALKKVNLKTADQFATEGYRNEISLLEKLKKNERIIRLVDFEVNDSFILMVMELGEVDLATLMKREQGNLSINFIRMYWEQMLQAVHAIHEENIIHTDLKPANFLLVEGSLKLIDFGIAKSIPNDTTNIHREHQTGTVNYMSPESITDITGSKRQYLKLGRPSDVWSLGCILYQMVFGQPPFGSITSMIKKLHAIVDSEYKIPIPESNLPLAVEVITRCLDRDPRKRLTIPELLSHPFLSGSKGALDLAAITDIVKETLRVARSGTSTHVDDIAKRFWQQLSRGEPIKWVALPNQ